MRQGPHQGVAHSTIEKRWLRSHYNVIVMPLTAAADVVVVALVVVVVVLFVVLFLWFEDLLNDKLLLAALEAQPHATSPISRAQPVMRSRMVITTNSTLPMPTLHLTNPLLSCVVGLVRSALRHCGGAMIESKLGDMYAARG